MTRRNNVIGNAEFKERAGAVINEIAGYLAHTYGPFGGDTVLEQVNGTHHLSKDGFKVLDSIQYEDNLERVIKKMLFDISSSQVLKVGDGSTSCIMASKYLFDKLHTYMTDNPDIRSKDVINALTRVVDEAKIRLIAHKKNIDKSMLDIVNIASIAANNDIRVGGLIHSIYSEIGRHGKINMLVSPNDKTFFKAFSGFKISGTVLDQMLINDKVNMKAVISDSNVFMFKGNLTGKYVHNLLIPLVRMCLETEGMKLTFISNGYGSDASVALDTLYKSNNISLLNEKLMFLYVPALDQNDKDMYEELAMYCDAEIVTTAYNDNVNLIDDETIDLKADEELENIDINKMIEKFGYCKKMECSYGKSDIIFFGGDGYEKHKNNVNDVDDEISKRIDYIKQHIAKVEEEYENSTAENVKKFKLEARLINFSDNGIANLYVGGKTNIEKTTQMYLIEDALKACDSAIKYGYTMGCGLATLKVLHELMIESFFNTSLEKNMLDILFASFKGSYMTLIENKYGTDMYKNESTFEEVFHMAITEGKVFNLITEEYELDTIINSVKTEIEILDSTSSIIGLLVGSNQFIGLKINE